MSLMLMPTVSLSSAKMASSVRLFKSSNPRFLLTPFKVTSMYQIVVTMKLRYSMWTAILWDPLLLVNILGP